MRATGARKASADPVGESQPKRLSFIELCAFFRGEVGRADLEARFGIRPAAATRDFLIYRTLSPDNLRYDTSAKSYVSAAQFKPVFAFDTSRVLSWLIQGFGDGLSAHTRRPIPGEAAVLLFASPLQTLATITRAIHQAKPLAIRYWSVSSGESRRTIVLFALVDSGLRWRVRAYDRVRARFGDFVSTRIAAPRIPDETPAEQERPLSDHQWDRMVDIELVPNPGLGHPGAVEADHRIGGGILKQSVRAAVACYALHRWQEDCSPDHRLDPKSHHLWQRNILTLYGVESAVMARAIRSTDLRNDRRVHVTDIA
jgi:hypothetical protein